MRSSKKRLHLLLFFEVSVKPNILNVPSISSISRTVVPLDYSRLDQRLVKAARGMEANFMKQMVRAMRTSTQESPETKNNKGLQLFRGMLDDKYADSAADQGGVGIADLIIRHLLEQSGTIQQYQKHPPKPKMFRNVEPETGKAVEKKPNEMLKGT